MKIQPRVDTYFLPIEPVSMTSEKPTTMVKLEFTDIRPEVRTSVMRKFLKHKFSVSRKQANNIIRLMGFDDLLVMKQA